MKILIYSMNFSPEIVGVGKYNGELVEWLLREGYQVHVVTAYPYYPAWRVWSTFSKFKYTVESQLNGRCKVFRCPLYVPRNPSGALRVIHLFSFFISSLPVMCLQLFWKPDIVFLTEPPLICSPIALAIGWLSKSKNILHIHDFEIDAAFNLKLVKIKFLRNVLTSLESRVMNAFTMVSTISNKMLSRLVGKGVQYNKTALLKNWVDLKLINPERKSDFYKAEQKKIYRIPDDHIVALYSGNMGYKQGLEVLASVARMAKYENIFFVFSGEGPARKKFEGECSDLPKVKFIPLQEQQSFVDLLLLTDIHLLPQRDDVADLVMPSKLTGMLASGSPIIATAREGTELASIVIKCGVVVPPSDVDAFYKALYFLANSSKDRLKLGKIARNYAEKELNQDTILRNFFQRFDGAL